MVVFVGVFVLLVEYCLDPGIHHRLLMYSCSIVVVVGVTVVAAAVVTVVAAAVAAVC